MVKVWFLSADERSFETIQLQDTIQELQSAIKVERQQSLSWMEKHNSVRDALRLASAEADEFRDTIDGQSKEIFQLKTSIKSANEDHEKMRERLDVLTSSIQQQKDEIQQLSTLYKTERDATAALEKALASEKENFNRYILKKQKLNSTIRNLVAVVASWKILPLRQKCCPLNYRIVLFFSKLFAVSRKKYCKKIPEIAIFRIWLFFGILNGYFISK